MNKLHHPKNGSPIMISEMSDEHLKNTIQMYLNQLTELKQLLTQEPISRFKKAVYRTAYAPLNLQEVEHSINYKIEFLHPYLSEAMLRGIYFTIELQQVFERTGADILPRAFDSLSPQAVQISRTNKATKSISLDDNMPDLDPDTLWDF